jgi:HEAT repeat protein
VSWHAHREAEKAHEIAWVEALRTFVETSKSKDERSAAYFILGALGVNTGDARCAEVLVARVSQETDKYLLAAALDAVTKVDKPAGLPLDNVFNCLADKRWLVRQAAIRALQKTHSPEAEARVLEHLTATDEPYDMVYCHRTLASIGSERSLAALNANLGSRKRDVKASAAAAIRAIKSRNA